MSSSSQTSPATLTKAVLRAAGQLELTGDLAALLQLSAADAESLQSGARTLDPQREEWVHALKIVSLFRSLMALVGTVERARAWLGAPNQTLGAAPLDLLRSSDAERVHRYLDAVLKNELRLRQDH